MADLKKRIQFTAADFTGDSSDSDDDIDNPTLGRPPLDKPMFSAADFTGDMSSRSPSPNPPPAVAKIILQNQFKFTVADFTGNDSSRSPSPNLLSPGPSPIPDSKAEFTMADFTGDDSSRPPSPGISKPHSKPQFSAADFTGDDRSPSPDSPRRQTSFVASDFIGSTEATEAETSSPSMTGDIDIGPDEDEEMEDSPVERPKIHRTGKGKGFPFITPPPSSLVPPSSQAKSIASGKSFCIFITSADLDLVPVFQSTPVRGSGPGVAFFIPPSPYAQSHLQDTPADDHHLPNLSTYEGRWALSNGLNIPGVNFRTMHPNQRHLQSLSMTLAELHAAHRRAQAELAAAVSLAVSFQAELEFIETAQRGDSQDAKAAAEELERTVNR